MAVIVLDTHFVSPRCFQRTELFRGSSYLMFKFRTQAGKHWAPTMQTSGAHSTGASLMLCRRPF